MNENHFHFLEDDFLTHFLKFHTNLAVSEQEFSILFLYCFVFVWAQIEITEESKYNHPEELARHEGESSNNVHVRFNLASDH